MDITTATPVEIDTVLYDLYQQQATAAARLEAAQTSVLHTAGAHKSYRGMWDMTYADAADRCRALESDPTYVGRYAREALERVREAHKVLASLRTQAAPLNAEFDARGGWTRAFLAVTNGNGHVHSSMDCSTCNRQGNATRFAWMVEYSGKDEAEIVEAAAERACTVCYPSAPVETLRRPTKMFSEDEIAAQKAREERAAKKAAAESEKITVEGFIEYGRSKTKEFKTLRAASQAASSAMADILDWGSSHPTAVEWGNNFGVVCNAIAAKTGQPVEQVRAEHEAKGQAIYKRRQRG